MNESGGEAADPDAGRRGLAEMNRLARCLQSHGFVVLAFFHADFRSWTEPQPFYKFQELSVLFIHANYFRFVFCAQVGEQNRALLAKLRNASADRNTVRATALATEPLEQQRFHFRRDRVLESLGFVMSFRPRKTDDVREQHFG